MSVQGKLYDIIGITISLYMATMLLYLGLIHLLLESDTTRVVFIFTASLSIFIISILNVIKFSSRKDKR